MTVINQLHAVNLRDLIDQSQRTDKSKNAGQTNQKDFGDTISDFLKAVNDSSKEASRKAADVVQGKSENLHEAMTSLEEAKLSFQLLLEIRNKLMESFQEINRMQV